MASGFNIRDVDSDAFISDQRQGEGKGGDRGMSLQIIDDVLQNSKGLFEENGLGDEIAEKLKVLWISKLEAMGENSKKKQCLPKVRSKNSKKVSSASGMRKESSSKLKHRRKDDSKAILKSREEPISKYDPEDILPRSSILGAPKSVSSRKNLIIGGQVDGPNDTSDEDEDIGKI